MNALQQIRLQIPSKSRFIRKSNAYIPVTSTANSVSLFVGLGRTEIPFRTSAGDLVVIFLNYLNLNSIAQFHIGYSARPDIFLVNNYEILCRETEPAHFL